MNKIDYNELLNVWHDKVIEKADKILGKADDYEFGSKEYFKYRNYANGLYDALAMLDLEERKAKRRLKKRDGSLKVGDRVKIVSNKLDYYKKHAYSFMNLDEAGIIYSVLNQTAVVMYGNSAININKEDLYVIK